MSFPFKRILSPIDFDENSLAALELAAQIARQNDGTVIVFHVVPLIAAAAAMPVYVDAYRGQEETAQDKLQQIAAKRLPGLKYELLTHLGEPAGAIVRTARRAAADVIVMATHGRSGFSRVVLGSIAEMVLRESPCPVLCVRHGAPGRNLVARWMSSSPVVAGPNQLLSTIQERMHDGGYRCAPVVEDGQLVGIVTDRDVRANMGRLDRVEARYAMTADPITVEPSTPLRDAARLLFERKLDALPVLEDGKLAGIITSSDILRAFLEED